MYIFLVTNINFAVCLDHVASYMGKYKYLARASSAIVGNGEMLQVYFDLFLL